MLLLLSHTHLIFQDGIKLPIIKDEKASIDEDKLPSLKDEKTSTDKDKAPTEDESDDDALCPSCRMHPGTNGLYEYCQKGEFKLCDDCYVMMPTEVKFETWCRNCRTCCWGNIQVGLGGDSEENKKAICSGRPCDAGMDIRGRCLPVEDVEDSKYKFVRCPARVDTMAWWIGNESDLYNSAMKGDYTFLDEFDFTDNDKMNIIAVFNVDR